MIDFRMETFLTLCNVMNYRKTAEILNMTQPAVTQHIHSLEKYYGCKLFIYDRKSLKMTKKAYILKSYAENVLYQEKKVRTLLADTDKHHFSIGATKTIGDYVISDHVSNFIKEPANSLSVVVDNTEHLLDELSNGNIDFALIEGAFDRSKYACRLYKREPFVGICSVNHKFAGKKVSYSDILKEKLIVREEGSGTRNILTQMLFSHEHYLSEFKKITTVNSFGMITSLIEKGDEITFAYRAVMHNNPLLAQFFPENTEIIRELNYVYLDTPYTENAVDYFDSFRII